MEAMRQSWTDDRMDDLALRVDNGFEQVDRRFEQVDRRFEQVDQRFEQVDRRFEQTQAEIAGIRQGQAELQAAFERDRLEVREEQAMTAAELRSEIKAVGDGLNDRFDALQRILIVALFGGIFMLIAAVVGLIGVYAA